MDLKTEAQYQQELSVVWGMLDTERRAREWQPIETAPKDGTQVLLLVEFEDHATEDVAGPARTIGANNDDNVGEGEGVGWQFAGWCWCHDHYTQGTGKAIAWQPMPPNTGGKP